MSSKALAQIEETLGGVFNYYAQVATGRAKDAHKPKRLMTSARFQRMAFDANLLDDDLSPAQVDLVFRQACGKKGRLDFEGFMDAMVLLALAKFPDLGPDLREFTALSQLFETYLSSFNGEINDPLEAILTELDDEWYHLMVAKGVASVLHEIYVRYFPIEVNPHYREAATTAEAHAAKNFLQLAEDFAVVRQVNDLRAMMYAAVRDAGRTALPPEIYEKIRVQPSGKFFTFHHFLVTLQKLADMQYREGSGAQKMAQLLNVMEQARSPYGKVKFLPPGLVTDTSEVITPKRPEVSAEARQVVERIYNYYTTLGEPLKREMSTRKWMRFLRDAGIVSPEMGSVMSSQMGSRLGGSQMSQSKGERYRYAFSPTKSQQASYAGGAPLATEDTELPLRVFEFPPLNSVDADLIFVKARQGRHMFSLMARKGFKYRERGEYGAGYYCEIPGSGENSRDGATASLKGVGAGLGAGQATHIDQESFMNACQSVAIKVYFHDSGAGAAADKASSVEVKAAEHLERFCAEILVPLIEILADTDTLLKAADVPAFAEEVSQETAILFKSVWEGLDKIWKAYKNNSMPGWLIDDFIDMMTEFTIIERIKPVIARRIFYVHAKPSKNMIAPTLTFETMLDTLVLVAEKVEQANVFASTTGRVLALLHHMNQVCFRTRLAHLRPLFILPLIPETVVQDRKPQGWQNMLSTLQVDGGKESAFQRSMTEEYA